MTARQFYIMFFIMVVSLKVQKLPSLVSAGLGKDTYLLPLFFLIINLLLIVAAFFILNHLKKKNLISSNKSFFGKVFEKIIEVGLAVYFLSQSLLLYESIQNLFAHILFYELPWTLFSLMLTAAVFYLAVSGIKNIALNFELYGGLIIVSYLIISIFGGVNTDFSSILPLEETNLKLVFDAVIKFNLWFGDFFLVIFMGKSAKNIKLKWTTLVYAVAMLFVGLLYIEFFGIYKDYSPLKPSLISVLSEQSMLGVNIGRIDWFFILFTEIGTILSSAACLYFSKQSIKQIFPKLKNYQILLGLVAVLYFVDVFYLVDTFKKEELFLGRLTILSLIVKMVSLVVMLLICFHENIKSSKEKNNKKIAKKPKEYIKKIAKIKKIHPNSQILQKIKPKMICQKSQTTRQVTVWEESKNILVW